MSNIFILSGPAAVGKTTVSKLVMEKFPDLQKTMTFTTRPQRGSGNEDKIMNYISQPEFEKKIKDNDFIEWAFVHGNYYGTDKKYLEDTLKKGDIIMNIDVQGGLQMKKLYLQEPEPSSKVKHKNTNKSRRPETILIFIKPESFTQLKNRLIKRQKPLPEIPQSRNQKLPEIPQSRKNKDLQTRLKNTKKELKLGKKYDYKIKNREGKINQTVNQIAQIINKHLSID